MREIKFRMWSPKSEKYFYGTEPLYCLISQTSFNSKEEILGDIPFDFIAEGFVFEQYTGLKDKNGKEIYDGDKIKYWHEEKFFKVEVEGHIEWDEIEVAFLIVYYSGSILISSLDVTYCMFEVIGNIHEVTNETPK